MWSTENELAENVHSIISLHLRLVIGKFDRNDLVDYLDSSSWSATRHAPSSRTSLRYIHHVLGEMEICMLVQPLIHGRIASTYLATL
jgi:hypothetical protein